MTARVVRGAQPTNQSLARDSYHPRLRNTDGSVFLRYHRVRNNLTMVANLFNLQARDVGAEVRDQLLKAATRMQSIAEVHAALCRGSSHESVQLESYLTDLCASLSKALLLDHRTAINVRSQPVAVTVDMAIPLSMAVTEMVINDVRCAYPSSEGGDSWVATACCGNRFNVTIADTGVGFEQTAVRSDGLGMRLVKSFARQLNGGLAICHDQGSTIDFIVPWPGDAGREPNSPPGVSGACFRGSQRCRLQTVSITVRNRNCCRWDKLSRFLPTQLGGCIDGATEGAATVTGS